MDIDETEEGTHQTGMVLDVAVPVPTDYKIK
jgi:hypothetical protein